MFELLLLFAPRLQVHTKHHDLFAVVEHLVDRILLLEWKAAGKNADPICWLRSRVPQCSLLSKKDDIAAILDSGLEWRKKAQEPMCACIDGGSHLASALFSACVIETVKDKVCDVMEAGVKALISLRPAFGMSVRQADVDRIRGETLVKVNGVKAAFGA